MAIQFESSIDVDGRGIIGSGNTIGTINASIIGANNNATTLSTVDSNTNTIIGDSNSGRYGNTVITDRTLRLGRVDNISATSSNTTGILNFNDSVLANTAYSNIGGIVGYFPPPTTTNSYHFFNALDENVDTNVFQTGASPTASRYSMSSDPNLSSIGQKFDANTTNSGAMYITASNNSSTASSRGIFTFDARHQNQNSTVPDGHSLFEVTSGYGQTKFLIKQVSGSTNVGIGTTNPTEKLHVVDNSSANALAKIRIEGGSSSGYGDIGMQSGYIRLYSNGTICSAWTGGTQFNYINGSAATTLNPNGLGIGTTGPTQKLHVAGNMRLQNQLYDSTNSQGANNDVLTKVSAGTEWKSISDLPIDGRYVAVAGDTMTGNLILDNGSTASPYVATQQASYPWGGSLTLGLRMRTDATAGILDFRRWTGSATTHGTALITQVNSDGGYGLDFRVDNKSTNTSATTSRMFLSTSGEVGIGTTSPASKLEVAGDTSNALLTLKSLNGGANDAFMRFYDEGNGPAYSMGLDSSDEKFKIAYASDGDSLTSGTKLVMETSGNVAIGATTATEKLVVSGNAWITNNVYVGYGNTLKTCSYSPNYSLIVGENNTLGGVSNGIIGVSNTIECTAEPWQSFGGNFIAGKNNTINNLYSHANAVFGQSNAVGDPTTPSNSVAGILVSGVGHSTFGDNSFAFGESCFTDINAKRSLTGGFDCNNFGYYGSVAIGAGATASTGNNQYAFGTGVTTPTSASAAYDSNQFVVGKFNVYSTGGRAHRFAVGNGFSDGFRSNAMNIDTFGRMGLGVTAPSYQLQLNSNSAAKPTSSSWTVVSDERVKTNIQDYTTGLTEILQINPKTFDYNGKAGFDTTTGNIGIIAQDVKDIMPETINTYNAKLNEDDTEDTELFNFDSHPVQFALINAIKELNSKIEALEAKIQILEGN